MHDTRTTPRCRLRHVLRMAGSGLLMLPLLWAGIAVAGPVHEDASTLVRAAKADRVQIIRQSVRNGADINAAVPGDGTALIVAARRGELDLVDALLGMGADVDRAVPGDGSPLIAAAARGRLAVVKRLIAAGAHVDAVVPGDETALISAVRARHLDVARLLVAHGADVNLGAMANGNQWRTPLNQAHSAAMRRFLRAHGATRHGHAS